MVNLADAYKASKKALDEAIAQVEILVSQLDEHVKDGNLPATKDVNEKLLTAEGRFLKALSEVRSMGDIATLQVQARNNSPG